MKYHGEVCADDHRYVIEGEHGYAPLVSMKIEHPSFKSEFYMEPEQARELARHLSAAADTALTSPKGDPPT